jgi:NAD-specific glutamate dehydrogenase
VQRQGLRVFSAIRPVFTVRRQWERICSIGGPIEEGPLELYCRFRIERVESPERLRRIEHQVFAVLKAVFLAVDDFGAMTAAVRDLASRVASRRGSLPEVETARAFLGWLLDNNYVFLGLAHFRSDGGQLHADAESALGLFRIPRSFPWCIRVCRAAGSLIRRDGGGDRILSIDYCAGASALHQLPAGRYLIRVDGRGRPAATTWLPAVLPERVFRQRTGDSAAEREAGLAARAQRQQPSRPGNARAVQSVPEAGAVLRR